MNLMEILPEARFVGSPTASRTDVLRVRHCTTDPNRFAPESALVLMPGSDPVNTIFQGRFRWNGTTGAVSAMSVRSGRSGQNERERENRWSEEEREREEWRKTPGVIISKEPIPDCEIPVCVVPDPIQAFGLIRH
ncbi:MAG: hypothetical protein Q4C47_05170, partial [Planctomycetia bacterium]|nr:hypothetical protein [Planctomycetia bacterium]